MVLFEFYIPSSNIFQLLLYLVSWVKQWLSTYDNFGNITRIDKICLI